MNVKALFDKFIWALFMASNKEFFKARNEEHKLYGLQENLDLYERKTKACMHTQTHFIFHLYS